MCGIAGIVAENAVEYLQTVRKMTDTIAHRGPDGDGHHVYGRCVLGHRRLSIVDLGGGHQPMFNHSKSIGIVFNGEIYGYKKLRDETQYNYQNESDTELLIALYEQKGRAMMESLPGMFAFSIWDENKQALFCARDRFGEKPFYYAFGTNGEFIYSSEIKAILSTGLIEPVIDKESLAHYLKHLYVHPQKTIYKNIFTLPPAHTLEYSPITKQLQIERYWHMPETVGAVKLNDAIEQFTYLLDDAVKKQLIADVPVGAFLSGGLDSSTIVALASKNKEGIKTISFGFGDSINELPFAREIAKKYNTQHIELQQRETDIADLLMKMQDIYDEPFADSSNIPTYLISELAKEHLTVILTGDAGDELLGGYGSYKILVEMMKGKKTPHLLLPLLKYMLKFSSVLRGKVNLLGMEAAMSNTQYKQSIIDTHKQYYVYFTDNQLQQIGLGKVEKPLGSFTLHNTVDDAIKQDIEDYMPGDILVKTDRAAMASSVELRAPFLDVNFAEYCISLPHTLKVNSSQDKILLREAMGHLWTEGIRARSKQGFGAPVKQWLQIPGVVQLKQEFLFDKNNPIYKVINYDACKAYFNTNNYHTWALLSLAIWAKKHSYSIS